MNFAIQVLNFNNYQVTIKAIQAIMDNDFNDHDIFVLDNGSSNDSYARLKKNISEVGTTIYRPPYAPLSFSAIAGRSTYEFYDPTRKTSIHSWHVKNRAIFEDVGQWKRPWYFKKNDKETMYEAVQRESKELRNAAGILDGSTLGKIEIKGKDALEFVNLIYTNAFTKMKPMTARYALMLGEDGMIKDDGIVCKIKTNTLLLQQQLVVLQKFYLIWRNMHRLNGLI